MPIWVLRRMIPPWEALSKSKFIAPFSTSEPKLTQAVSLLVARKHLTQKLPSSCLPTPCLPVVVLFCRLEGVQRRECLMACSCTLLLRRCLLLLDMLTRAVKPVVRARLLYRLRPSSCISTCLYRASYRTQCSRPATWTPSVGSASSTILRSVCASCPLASTAEGTPACRVRTQPTYPA